MRSPRIEFLRHPRRWRWLATGAALALTPKCFLCLVAYSAAGAALGLSGPELCGAPSSSPSTWMSPLALPGIALGIIGFLADRSCRRWSTRSHNRP